ncbi:unnamed protein product [Nyctereutes procyonoides]|uniref:(raccoon dog) hypothetical protein n=1 Tax=Nyctereutes procyonoides TaxID=34880 RepID=A0A811YRV3_NYCPR|nr:unnamed protein product [Nyctereutes procyonoides]
MSHIQKFHSCDLFVDASKGDALLPAGTEKLVKAFKKNSACNGAVFQNMENSGTGQPTGEHMPVPPS